MSMRVFDAVTNYRPLPYVLFASALITLSLIAGFGQ